MLNNTYMYVDLMLMLLFALTFCQQLFYNKFNLYGILSILLISIYIAIHAEEGLNIFILLLFIGSILLIILEMFIPGGILGAFGVISLITTIILINKETYQISFIMLVSIIFFMIIYILKRKVFNRKLLFLERFILDARNSSEEGFVARESDVNLIGKKLKAYTDLRPSGIAILKNNKIDVVTEGDFIDKGSEIEVVKVEGIRTVVRKV